MLKTILLPLDGSPLAERALPYATALAHRSGASILLVEAVQSDAPSGWDARVPEVATVARSHGGLGEVANRLRSAGVKAIVRISHEDPVAAILDAAQLHRADLIVMSTHGRSGLGRLVYGSVADQILRHAEVPVLLVPAMIDHPWPTDRPLTVLVPLDGSAWGEAAIGALDTLAPVGPTGAKLLLMQAIERPASPMWGDGYGEGYVDAPFDEEAARASALSYLNSVATHLTDHGYTPCVEVALGSSAAIIAKVVHDRGIDLIAMATHGRSGLVRALLGSVVIATVQRGGVPILLTRPSEVRHARVSEQVSTKDTPVMVPLTIEDRDFVTAGLELVLAGTEREERQTAPIRAILARVADAALDRPKALATTSP